MKPLTTEEVTKFLLDADRIADRGRGRTGDLDVLSGFLLLKWASDQPGRFEIPERASWNSIATAAHADLGNTLARALTALVQANAEVLERQFWEIDFKRSLSERHTIDLVEHFNRISLHPANLKFPDTVAMAFDALLSEHADAAGKLGGEFHTPRSVTDLMVRLAQPRPGQSVYDPFAGSGGMLAGAEDFAAAHSGNRGVLELFAQDMNIARCRTTQLNLLLHGAVRPAIRNGDTLANPLHLTPGGSWRRFDRVLANPPFSVGYKEQDVRFPERMRYGWIRGTGRRADLMFVQHVLASLVPDGVGVVVSPQGVLYRPGSEEQIRREIVNTDKLVAVIGIGPNVFYGTSVPACILVLTGDTAPRGGRRGVFFINAEHEISTGRSRNRLDPRHVEKIAEVFHGRIEVPHFSRFVSVEEMEEDNFNLNIRRYISQPSSTGVNLDTRALVTGGVPRAEIEAQRERFEALGINLLDLFEPGEWGTMKFPRHGLVITTDVVLWTVGEREATFLIELDRWLADGVRGILNSERTLPVLRQSLIESFRLTMTPLRILDEFQLTGLFADWWAANHDHLREIVRSGECRPEVMSALQADLNERAKQLTAKQRRELMDIYRTWMARYGTSLAELDERRERSAAELRETLADLGIPSPSQEGRSWY
ncbi:class I SAM-dependent DNA methyltransferase [Lentzea sp. NPDC034063]|uniref:class I SAM-dependent DNA methyltransferase n=1 Tax=unclassified Lentzea TaxID=2643253 RepID=UPI003411C509